MATGFQPEVRGPLREAGIVSHLVTPFGVGSEVLGVIAAERLHHGQPWTEAEIDAVQSIAADLGRGLHHARLYEEENRLVEELQSVDHAKSDFIATVSHELRTPLTSITGYIEMLLDRDLGQVNSEQERMLGAVNRNASRLQALIEDLLTLSGMESGTFSTETNPVRPAGHHLRGRGGHPARRAGQGSHPDGLPRGRPGRDRGRQPARPGDDEPPQQRGEIHPRGRPGPGDRGGGRRLGGRPRHGYRHGHS